MVSQIKSQSTIKMDKGYYTSKKTISTNRYHVAIHNKNGQGLLHVRVLLSEPLFKVAIHNKNGQGLLLFYNTGLCNPNSRSQSTIKMDKGYYV